MYALYSGRSQILLLDDPLSALDSHVAAQVFKEGLLPLAREGAIVVLVTHAIQVEFSKKTASLVL